MVADLLVCAISCLGACWVVTLVRQEWNLNASLCQYHLDICGKVVHIPHDGLVAVAISLDLVQVLLVWMCQHLVVQLGPAQGRVR